MKTLGPMKLFSGRYGAEWFRLARTDDGVLCVESISDKTLSRPGPPAPWAYGGDVPPAIARQLENDDNPDQVVKVLDRAVRALGYDVTDSPGRPEVTATTVRGAVNRVVDQVADTLTEAGNAPVVLAAIGSRTQPLQLELPGELVEAIDRYLAIPSGKTNRLAALNAVAYIGERVATLVMVQTVAAARERLAKASVPPKAATVPGGAPRHPVQPVVLVDGVARFRQNRIVRWMFDQLAARGITANEIVSKFYDRYPPGGAYAEHEGEFEGEHHDDYQQLMQLIGYSLGGYAELSGHNPDVLAVAEAAAKGLKP